MWKLPEWTIVKAASEFLPDLTVNEAGYRGMLLCFALLSGLDRNESLFAEQHFGNPADARKDRLKAPGLQLLRQKGMNALRHWPHCEFLHMKRDWNQSADRLASSALQRELGATITFEAEFQDLVTLNRLPELLRPKDRSPIAHVSAATRSTAQRRSLPTETQDFIGVQNLRSERILQVHNEEKWMADLKRYLSGDVFGLTTNRRTVPRSLVNMRSTRAGCCCNVRCRPDPLGNATPSSD